MFAVMPIQKASTVHTTILAAIKSVGGSGTTLTYPFDFSAGTASPAAYTILKGQTGLTYKVLSATILITENAGTGSVLLNGDAGTPTALIPLTTAGALGVSTLGAATNLAPGEGIKITFTVPVAGQASGLAGTITVQVTQV